MNNKKILSNPLKRASSSVEITVLKGERVRVLQPDPGDGWTKVRTESEIVGFIPTSFIKFDPINTCDNMTVSNILKHI